MAGITAPSLGKIDGLIKTVDKQYGAQTMMRASEVNFAHFNKIPTGIFELDVQIGGGIAKGRVTLVAGQESVSKTTLCLYVIANAQRTCKACLGRFEWEKRPVMKKGVDTGAKEVVVTGSCTCGKNTPHVCSFIDAEGHLDPTWAELCGVNLEWLYLMAPQYTQQSSDVINALVRTGELDVLIYDSIAQSTPRREVEGSAEDGQRPDSALAHNRMWRTLTSSLNSLGLNNPNKPAIIVVNQHRLNIGVMHGDPTTLPGGLGQKFVASLRIDLRAGKKIDAKNKEGGNDPKKIGSMYHFSLQKNKITGGLGKGGFPLYTVDAPEHGVRKGMVDNFPAIFTHAVALGVIPKSGAWFDPAATFGDAWKNPDSKNGTFQGKDSLLAFLAADPEKVKTVKDRVMEAVRSGVTIGGGSDEAESSD